MQMKICSEDGSPLIFFKFRRLTLILSVTCGIVVLFVFLGALIMRQESLAKGMFFLVGTTAPFLIMGAIFLFGKSNIVISEQGISRRFLGKELQEMKWSDISVVRVFSMGRGPMGKNITGFNILSNRPHHGLLSRKIWFGEEADEIRGLVEVLNRYINEHKITVERTVDGITSKSNSISTI